MTPPSRLVLIIESDIQAIGQMRRVLAGMEMRAVAVHDDESLSDVLSSLVKADTPVLLIIARVALPTGSGIRLLEEASARFPRAAQMLVSHHPRNLLFSVPGFVEHSFNFLQAEFTDDQFRSAVERALSRGSAAH